ncbi:MAG: ABC transporter permease [Cytophagaceae bacterium]|nr:ABC transporter permease [Cytophagaceae bacterium]MDW8456433.1 ABC transporter permease [Cytophagaceae bacterium]
MLQYIIRRMLYGTLVLLGAVVVVFFIFNVLPGDPVSMLAGTRTDVAKRDEIARDLGLYEPLHRQLYLYLRDLSPVSVHENTPEEREKYEYLPLLTWGKNVIVLKMPYLRRSYQNNRRVSEIIWENMEGTFWLALAAMLFATIFGMTIGIIASLKYNTTLDHAMVSLSVIGISSPPYVIGTLMAMIFGYYLSNITGLNITGHLWDLDDNGNKVLVLKNIILPAITLGLRPLAIIVQLTRSSMLDVLSQDYIRTARAKGLHYYTIVVKHALKNALNPVITAVSGWLASLMAGAFFVEVIFGWKGLGTVTIDAINNLDFPIVMGVTIFVAFSFIIINILVDLLYALVDPRVRVK